MNTIYKQYREFGKGVKRSIIIGGFILPLIAGGIVTDCNGDWIQFSAVICYPIYWSLVFAGVWIYMGFKEDRK